MSQRDVILLEVDVANLIRAFSTYPPKVQAAIIRRVGAALKVAETRVRTTSGVKFRRGAAGLSGRLTSFVRRDTKGMIEGAIGFRKTHRFPYELAQELGANAHSGAMTIPISPEAKRLSETTGQGAGGFPRKLRLVKTKRAVLLVEDAFKMMGRGKAKERVEFTQIHYVLKKSLPPRLGFIAALQKEIGAINEAVRRGFVEGFGEAG